MRLQVVYSTVGVGDIPADVLVYIFNLYSNYAKQCFYGRSIKEQRACILKKKGCIPLDSAANMIKLSYLLPLLNMGDRGDSTE